MSNAHPNIMYQYALDNNVKLNGTFDMFIHDRDVVVDKVHYELNDNGFRSLEKKKVKKLLLSYFYRTWNCTEDWNLKHSLTLKLLDDDFKSGRVHLWDRFKDTDDEIYKTFSALQAKSEKRKMKEVFENGEMFTYLHECSLLQSSYCQTKETVALKALITHLRDRYEQHLRHWKITSFDLFHTNLNKEVDISPVHSLVMIPFFDGLFIYTPDDKFREKLNDHISEYNERWVNERFIFVEKEIKDEVKYIVDLEEYRKITLILSWLRCGSSVHIFTPFTFLLRNNKPDVFGLPTIPEEIQHDAKKVEEFFMNEHFEQLKKQKAFILTEISKLGDFNSEDEVGNLLLEYIDKYKDS